MTRAELILTLNRNGINVGSGWLLLDNNYEPITKQKIEAIANACLDSLPPELVTYYDVGGGKTVRIPKWVPEAGDCDNASLILWVWAMVGNWLKAVQGGLNRGGLAAGILLYSAQGRPENRGRTGPHCICWFIDPENTLRFYEFGDASETSLLPIEKASVFGGSAG
jgi:hypothetical protein